MDVVMESDYSVKVEMSEDPNRDPKDRLLDIMDRIEAHVEDLRRESLRLEERKDALFTTLDTIRNSENLSNLSDTDRDDIQRYIERVTARCMTVEISVRTDRDKQQEEALFQVNKLIDTLVISFKSDPSNSMTRCQSFLAACQDEPDTPVDKIFETSLLGCALDDQKRIKKRLCGLLDYLGQGRLTLVSNDIDSLALTDHNDKSGVTHEQHERVLECINRLGIKTTSSRRRSSECSEVPPVKRTKVEDSKALKEELMSMLRHQGDMLERMTEAYQRQSAVIKNLSDQLWR